MQKEVSYQPLLIWHWYCIAWGAGLWGGRYPIPSLSMLGVTACLFVLSQLHGHTRDIRFAKSYPAGLHRRTFWRSCFLLGAYCLGLVAIVTTLHVGAFFGTPEDSAVTVQTQTPVPLTGVVSEVRATPNHRLKIILEHVRYTDADGAIQPLSGKVVWTWASQKHAWEHAASKPPQTLPPLVSPPALAHSIVHAADVPEYLRPMVGETVSITAALKPVTGFRNKQMRDYGAYWREQGVHWRIWTWGSKGLPVRSGDVTFLPLLREKIRFHVSRLIDAIPRHVNNTFLTSLLKTRQYDDALHVLPALIFGDRYDFPSERYAQLSRASLSHSFALSGLHLGIVAMGISFLLSLCIRNGEWFEILSRPKLFALCILPASALYVWIGGGAPSLVRAFCMGACWCVLIWMNRPKFFVDGFFVAALCMTLASPAAVYDIRFQLSMMAIFGIIVGMPLISRGKKCLFPTAPKTLLQKMEQGAFDIFCISLCIQLAILPITIWNFNEFSIWTMLNILWLPLLGILVMPLLLAGLFIGWMSLGIPLLGDTAQLLFAAGAAPIAALFAMLDDMERGGFLNPLFFARPHWITILAWYASIVSLILWWRIEGKAILPTAFIYVQEGSPSWENRLFSTIGLPFVGDDIKKNGNETAGKGRPVVSSAHSPKRTPPVNWGIRITVTCCIALMFVPGAVKDYREDGKVLLNVLDVGQGQALVVTYDGGKKMLIDGGGFSSRSFDVGRVLVMPCITRQSSARLERIFNTHPDSDHIRGLFYPLKYADVGGYFSSGAQPRGWNKRKLADALAYSGVPHQALAAGDILPIATGLELQILHPPRNTTFTGNNGSLVMRLVDTSSSPAKGLVLLTGDIEKEGLFVLLGSGADLSADVLVLPHHGSASSFVPQLYSAVSPTVAVVSCGVLNKYHYPAEIVIKTLKQMGIPVLSTAESGEVELVLRDRE
ncbi:MAG: ComEC/Rec2 family competence protein [Desulfovibrionales bacterium]|nr:ComEC/Rec2 family competence protein [Desulfovibrionales bacterium]